MLKTYHYAVSRRSGSEALTDVLRSAGMPFLRDALPSLDRCYYDTFDWRLYAAGLVLFIDHRGERMRLCLREACSGLDLVAIDVSDSPRFADELPCGLVRERLTPLLADRRLLPVARLTSRQEEFRILNGESKTVVRASIGHHRVDTGERRVRLRDRLEVVPIRGFAEPLEHLLPLLDGNPAMEGLDADVLEEALRALDRRPLDYRPRPRLGPRPDLAVGVAARSLFAHLLDVIEINEDGVRQDLDPGFLHDLRVAVRRTRTLLGAMKHVLDAPHHAHYRGEFAWLGSVTGPVRDLDVHLGGFARHATALEPRHRRDLDPLRGALRARRSRERQHLLEALASPRYRTLKRGWRALLDDGEGRWAGGGKAALPVAGSALAMIRRRQARVVSRGRRLQVDSPDEDFHELRKQVKKLRYLLELFAGPIPAGEARPLLKSTKDLQKRLGACQDLSVHIAMLKELGGAVEPGGACGKALELLLDRMESRRRDAAADAAGAVSRFVERVDRNKFRIFSGDCDQEPRQ